MKLDCAGCTFSLSSPGELIRVFTRIGAGADNGRVNTVGMSVASGLQALLGLGALPAWKWGTVRTHADPLTAGLPNSKENPMLTRKPNLLRDGRLPAPCPSRRWELPPVARRDLKRARTSKTSRKSPRRQKPTTSPIRLMAL